MLKKLMPHVWSDPADTVLRERLPETGTGEAREITVVSPNCPVAL